MNGHMTDDITWPWKVNVVIRLWCGMVHQDCGLHGTSVMSTQVCCVRASNRKAMCSESDWVWHYPLSAHSSPAVTWRLWYRCCSPLIARLHISHADCYVDMFRVRAKICPVWALECCRISSPRFLAKSRKRWLNQGSFVFCCILCCLLFLGCA